MLRFDVDFYNNDHKKSLKNNCERYGDIQKLIQQGFEVAKEEFFSYCMFVHQKRDIQGWETYGDLRDRLPAYRVAWEDHFSFSKGTVSSKFATDKVDIHFKETMGVGGALSIASRIYELTEADWEKVNTGKMKTLDFSIASTGTHFVEVEAKGSIVPDHQKPLSHQKSRIETKKLAQRQQGNKNTMIGVITAIPSDNKLRARFLLLDPPPAEIPVDPVKYRLLARLYYYWRELRLVSRAHFLEVLINRIKSIQRLDDYESLDGLPLLNSRSEPHQVPDSLFVTRSSVYGRSAFGEVLPLGDGEFFFYGFDTDTVETLIRQDFSQLSTLSFESKTEFDTRVSAKIPRWLLDDTDTKVRQHEGGEFEDREREENRKTISMIGDLVHTSAGRVLGCVRPVNT